MNPARLTTRLEIKSLSSMQFEGHGAVFGNVDLGGDVILPGAFKRTLAEHRANDTFPSMFWMHDMSRVPGKWLDISEDENGLPVKGELAPTELGKEVHTLLKMDAVGGLSIGYLPKDIDYSPDGVRLLKEVELLEVSIVAIPMNPKAQITHVKSRLSAKGEYVPDNKELAEFKRDAERYLCSRGFSKRMAMMCAKNIFQEIDPGASPDSPKDDQRGEPDGQQKGTPSATPDELEVQAGLTGFKDRLVLLDLEKSFERIFRR